MKRLNLQSPLCSIEIEASGCKRPCRRTLVFLFRSRVDPPLDGKLTILFLPCIQRSGLQPPATPFCPTRNPQSFVVALPANWIPGSSREMNCSFPAVTTGSGARVNCQIVTLFNGDFVAFLRMHLHLSPSFDGYDFREPPRRIFYFSSMGYSWEEDALGFNVRPLTLMDKFLSGRSNCPVRMRTVWTSSASGAHPWG